MKPVAPGVMARLVELGRSSDDLPPHLREIDCPVLVMTGDSDPAATPDDAADIVAAMGNRAQMEVIADASHGVYRDQPDAFIDAVQRLP